jgi:hypothetical protein
VRAQQVDDVGCGHARTVTAEEPAGDHPAGDVLTAARERLLEVRAARVPAQQAGGDLEPLAEGQRTAVRHGRRRDDRVPAALVQQAERSEVRQEVAPRDVHHLQVHAVVHVPVEVQVAEADPQLRDRRVEHPAAGNGTARAGGGQRELDHPGHSRDVTRE